MCTNLPSVLPPLQAEGKPLSKCNYRRLPQALITFRAPAGDLEELEVDISTLELEGKTGAGSGANGEKGMPRRGDGAMFDRHIASMPRCHNTSTSGNNPTNPCLPPPTPVASIIPTVTVWEKVKGTSQPHGADATGEQKGAAYFFEQTDDIIPQWEQVRDGRGVDKGGTK